MILNFTSVDAFCPTTNDGLATVTVSGGTAPYTYQWDDAYSQVTPTAINLIAATYTVYVTDAAGTLISGTVVVGFSQTDCADLPPSVNVPFIGDTIAFSKTRNRWVTRYSFNPELYGAIRNEILCFKDGELWLQSVNPIYNNFFGVQFDSHVTIALNKLPLKVKYFNAVATSSNSVWDVPGMSVKANVQYPLGMASFLPASKFKAVQGKYYSEILRDVNTPGFPTVAEALINGRPMTGQAMSMTLRNPDTTEAVLLSIEVIYTYSEKS